MHLSPRQFASAIGVSESSVRRWADSGRIKMTRTPGGHRKIARSEAIRFIRHNAVSVVRPDLLQISEPRHRRRRAEAFAAQHDELAQALEEGNSELAFGLLWGMYVNGVSAADICDGPLRSAMQRIGDIWPSDPRGIFVEHRATNICIDVLNRLRSSFARSEGKLENVIGGAPEGDPYILPSLMAATVLVDSGHEAINLGPNTPLEVLSQSALETGARLVWVALTAPLPRTSIEPGLASLVRDLNKKAHIVLGGRAASRYRIPDVGNLHIFASMSEMAGFARGLRAKPHLVKS
jgi:excisionase family DNA binding protein